MMSDAPPTLTDLSALRAKGAPRVDAVGWHYIETLAERMQSQSGLAQQLLQAKLQEALKRIEGRMAHSAAAATAACAATPHAAPSPMAALLQDMVQRNAPQGHVQEPGQSAPHAGAWRAESPRIQQFRRQLSKISVQKQVTQAIAQAPQNAGPINSHMLVLRSLGLMRNISPDYLNRFMTHVDTLLRLDEADKGKLPPKKAPAAKPKK